MTPHNARYRALFRAALRIRRVEERIVALYPSDKIQSPVHLSIGQEAVAVGICAGLRPTDPLCTTYRGHAFYLAKGGDLSAMLAELYGRANGISGGKAGSMHLAAPEVGLMGASAVVASGIPHAVGAALAARVRRSDQVTVAVFGDGAAEQGVYHESLNFAALHRCPVLFVCENNGLAVHAAQAERQAFAIVAHAGAYGIAAARIADGQDMCGIADRVAATVAAIRQDGQPRLLEIMTCRYREHVGPGEDFAAGYRARADVEAWMARDPLLTEADLIAKFAPAIDAEIDAAEAFAEAGALPDRAALLADVG
jgi:pyruvate dehydrogenase E1 component alpha subunit